MSNARHYLLNVLVQGLSRAIAMGSAFLAFILVARVLGTEALGDLAFLMAYLMLAGVGADFGTTSALGKDLANELDGDPRGYFSNYLAVRASLALLAILVALPLSLLLRPDLADLLVVTSIAIPFVGSRVFETVYQVFHKPQYSVYSALFLGITQASLASILLLVFEVGLEGYVAGYVLTQLGYFLVTFGLAVKLLQPRAAINRSSLIAIISLAAPMGAWSLLNTISARADILMLSYWRSAHEVGLYNAAYRILDLASAIAFTAAIPLVPLLTKKFSGDSPEDKTAAVAKIIELTFIFCLPVALFSLPLATPLLVLIYGEAFRESASYLPIFACLFVILALVWMGSAVNLSADNVRHAWWSAAIAAAINIGANAYLVPRYGGMGAAWASLGSNSLMLLISQAYIYRNIGNIFRADRWLRITLAAIAGYTLLHLPVDAHPLVNASLGLAGYFAAITVFGLLPFEHLRSRQPGSKQES